MLKYALDLLLRKLIFEIPGPPMAKQRHRTTKTGHTYTPKETVNYEGLIKMIAAQEVAKDGRWQTRGQYALRVAAYFPVPKSRPKAWKELALANKIHPTTRPDWDNVGKIVSDALNGIVWHDDSMVVQAMILKAYSDRPRVEVVVWDLTDRDDRWTRKG